MKIFWGENRTAKRFNELYDDERYRAKTLNVYVLFLKRIFVKYQQAF